MSMSHVKMLVQLPILRGLSEEQAGAIAEIAEETTIARGENLFKEGEEGDALYIILQGHMEILKSDRAGNEQSLAKVGDGSVIGEMSLIQGRAARSATARAVTDARLLKMSSDRFQSLLQKDNVGALKIVHNIAQVMSRRLSMMDEKVVDMLDKGKKKEEFAAFQKILTNWSF
jgi:CRP/FNR family transcriptional regulator, cyclic AMP receptor protein